jgi:DNA-binding response OmpR family regulator
MIASKILIVDNEPAFCDIMREFLVRKGFQVVVANGGDKALAICGREWPYIYGSLGSSDAGKERAGDA